MIALKPLRDARSLSQSQLAELSSMGERTVQRIETDESYDPRLSKVIALSDALGVSLDVLVHGEDGNPSVEAGGRNALNDTDPAAPPGKKSAAGSAQKG